MLAADMTSAYVVDPEILAARAEQAKLVPGLDITSLPAAEARRLSNIAAGMFNDGLPELARVEDVSIDGPGGAQRLRLFFAPEPRQPGAVLYVHGGGWFSCNVDTHDRMMRLLALEAGATVIGVDYRLSPEHPFPAAFDDCKAAWDWVRANSATLGIDPAKIVVAGDSAGANLVLALTIHLRDNGLPMPAGGALLYGCFAPGLDTDSARRFGQGGFGLTAARMMWYWKSYLGAASDDPPLLAAPLRADLHGLPPQFLAIAEADTSADDSRLMLDRMKAAGVDASLTVWPGTVHGFLQMTQVVESARKAISDTARALLPWIS